MHPWDVNYCNVINVNHVFLLGLVSVSISCQFHVRKIWILLIFSNDFRKKNINKNNIEWFTRTWSWVCCSSVFTKKAFWPNLLCFVSLYLLRSCLVLVAHSKTNIPRLFSLIWELFTIVNIIFKSASRRWMLITSGE